MPLVRLVVTSFFTPCLQFAPCERPVAPLARFIPGARFCGMKVVTAVIAPNH